MKRREGTAICGAELPDSLEDLLNEGEVEEGLKESKERKKKAEKQK